ncbi:MAG: hypothetical protein GXP55_09670 [Deltaproteobacteria bacterium]|nr:hypothetical protein [Deltaproteobacteria bacterium]
MISRAHAPRGGVQQAPHTLSRGESIDLRTGDEELGVDFAIILLVSVAISFAAQRLVLMSVLIPAALALRMLLWRKLMRATPRQLGVELLFIALCALLAGFNDWNSVVRHGIYAYDVPVFFPQISSIPFWMLLYWGLILRFLLTLALWRRLGVSREIPSETRLGPRLISRRPTVRVALLLLLVVVTRQIIYVRYEDPIWSWLPFLLASAAYVFFFGLRKSDAWLCAFMLLAGPAIEVLYIRVGGLHHYALGWFGGVPLWIALWWLLGVLVWKDLGARLLSTLRA